MGNICTWEVFYYTKEKRCIKCNDIFIPSYGEYSQRRSCREHLYNDGICIYCQKEKMIGSWNCYHLVN